MEAENTKNIGKLYDQMHELNVVVAKLSVTVEEGFKGVHRRQDITNGRIAKSEVNIQSLQTVDAGMQGQITALASAQARDEESARDRSTRWHGILYSTIEKVIWIAIGGLLLSGPKIYSLFF